MDALLATAHRPASDRGETRCRGERRRSSSRHFGHQKKSFSRRYRDTPCGVPSNRAEGDCRSRVSANLAKCAEIADPEVARFGQLSPTHLLRAQQAKIPHEKSKGLRGGSNPSKGRLDHSWDAYAAGQTFARSCAPLRRCKGERYDLHSKSGRRVRRY
jgi:hypothetical protein